MNLSNLLPFIGLILVLAGVPAFIEIYKASNDLTLSVIITVIYELIVITWGFLSKVWQRLEGKWSERLADWIDSTLQSIFSKYKKRYLEYMVYQHRDFDVKGLTTQGPYNLELEKVFVELSVDPKAPGATSANPIQSLPEDLRSGKHTIWQYLSGQNNVTKLAILGAPGSGKTTLLKHIALVLAASQGQKRALGAPNLMPILLYLRDHSAAIHANPDLTLTALIDEHLKHHHMPPPPQGWFEQQLEGGRCLVMLDGLDEVADPQARKGVVKWVESCMTTLGKNHFVVTSRPHGYTDNPLGGVTVLEVRPFSSEQITKFVHNWYLANEIRSSSTADPGVREKAREGGEDLLRRIRVMPTLTDLAVNPLLLTMIATVHRYRSSLPGRRVELYGEICEVFLGKRQAARGVEDDLTPAQKMRVLRELAYYMMVHEERDIPKQVAARQIAEVLSAVSPGHKSIDFLQMVENGSGLLIERENGQYSFSHKTFQEYLAATHILEQRLESKLVRQVMNPWWHETIRLYCAQTDASLIITACLEANTVDALSLAIACMSEAREVNASVRMHYHSIIDEGLESPDEERRHLVSQALLNDRLR